MEHRIKFNAVDVAAENVVESFCEGAVVQRQERLDKGQEKGAVAETRLQHFVVVA